MSQRYVLHRAARYSVGPFHSGGPKMSVPQVLLEDGVMERQYTHGCLCVSCVGGSMLGRVVLIVTVAWRQFNRRVTNHKESRGAQEALR